MVRLRVSGDRWMAERRAGFRAARFPNSPTSFASLHLARELPSDVRHPGTGWLPAGVLHPSRSVVTFLQLRFRRRFKCARPLSNSTSPASTPGGPGLLAAREVSPADDLRRRDAKARITAVARSFNRPTRFPRTTILAGALGSSVRGMGDSHPPGTDVRGAGACTQSRVILEKLHYGNAPSLRRTVAQRHRRV